MEILFEQMILDIRVIVLQNIRIKLRKKHIFFGGLLLIIPHALDIG